MEKEKAFRPSAVIFDMDGLLFDTENLTIPMWQIAGKPFGYNITPEIVLKMVGISRKRATEVLIDEFGKDFPFGKIREAFGLILRKEIEENGVPKKKGVDYLFDRLAAAKIPFGLATSTSRENATYMLNRAGILDKFAAVTCGDEVENGKPAPDIFLKAAGKLGQPPETCVGFEDSTAGLMGLHAAGIRSVFIKDVIQPPENVLAAVWKRCDDLTEAAEILNL